MCSQKIESREEKEKFEKFSSFLKKAVDKAEEVWYIKRAVGEGAGERGTEKSFSRKMKKST